MKRNQFFTFSIVLFASLASLYSTGVESFPLAATSHTVNDKLWHSSHSSGGEDEKRLRNTATGSSLTSSESAFPAHSSSRNVPESSLGIRRTPTESTWPAGHSANAQQVDLQQVNQSPQSISLDSQNEAHSHEQGGSSGYGKPAHFGRIMGDEDVDPVRDTLSLPDAAHNMLFDLSSLDSETMMSMLNMIKNDPDTFNELIGLKPTGESGGGGSGGVSSSSNGKSRNSRNRAAYEADVLQKVLQVYQDKVAPKLLLVKRGEGPQLSVVSPLDVLRQQLLYELARRRSKELQEKIQVNEQLLKSLGKRSVDPNDGPDDSPQ